MAPKDYPANAGQPDPAPTPGIGAGGYDPRKAADASTTVSSGSLDIYGLGDTDFLDQEILLRAAHVRGAQFVLAGHSGAAQRAFAEANQIPTGSDTLPEKGKVKDQIEAFIRMSGDPTMQKDYLGWQRLLYGAGFYGTKKATDIAWGTWDSPTKDALVGALKQMVGVSAAGSTATFEEYLNQLAKRRAELGIGTDQPTKQVQSFTDPAAIQRSAQSAAEAALGRRLNEKEVKKFQMHFHNLEVNAYEDAAKTGQYANPSLEAQAGQFAEDVSPAEYGGQRLGEYVSAFEKMVGVNGA